MNDDQLINSPASIKALNIRKQGPDDDQVLAIDITFADCEINHALFARLMGSTQPDVRTSFWDEDNEPRFPGLEPVASWSVIESCTVTIGNVACYGCTVKKFKCAIRGEAAVVADLQVTVKEPSPETTARLAELIKDEVRLVVIDSQMELPLERAGASASHPAHAA